MSELSETNATLDYFCDFEKAIKNVDKVKIKLNQLNYLIGQEDMKGAINHLFEENPKTFEVLEILLAVRTNSKKKTINKTNDVVKLNSYVANPELIYEFIDESGLLDVFQNKHITNLVDYVFGVEIGLDTNARKNRGGKQMERAVAKVFENNNIAFTEQVRHTIFPRLQSLGEDVKQFDFVIKTSQKIYLIETNYYNSGGSKLNETARAYTDIAPKINQYDAFEFVWITDGQGWYTAKNKLEEAYSNIPKVYNLKSVSEFIKIVQQEIE